MNKQLKILIETKGSLTEVANTLGVTCEYLNILISGRRTSVSPNILLALASILEIPASDLRRIIKNNSSTSNTDINHEQFQFYRYLEMVLDALESNNREQRIVAFNKIKAMPDSIVLKENFLIWHTAIEKTFSAQFKDGLEGFITAKDFKPKLSIEKRFKARILGGIGGAYTALGDYKAALKAFRDCLKVWNEGKFSGLVYLNLGTLYRRKQYMDYAKESYELAYKLGADFVKLEALASLIQLYLDQKELDKARRCVIEGYLASKMYPDPWGQSDLLVNTGVYFNEVNKTKRARFYLNKAIDTASKCNKQRAKHYALLEISLSYLKDADFVAFLTTISSLEKELKDGTDVLLIGGQLLAIGRSHVGKETHKALIVLGEAYRFLTDIPPSSELLECCKLLKECHTINRTPYTADFYKGEIRRLKKELKPVKLKPVG